MTTVSVFVIIFHGVFVDGKWFILDFESAAL